MAQDERPAAKAATNVVSFTDNNDTEEESLRMTVVSEKDSKKNRKSKP